MERRHGEAREQPDGQGIGGKGKDSPGIEQRHSGTWDLINGQSIEGTGKDIPSMKQHPAEAGHRFYG